MTEQNAPARSRILAIAPYEGMNTAMQHAIEAYPEADFDIYTADLEAALDILNELNLQLYDCIISRGGTAELLRKKTALPVVEIPISIYDILRTIKLAENYSKRYAVVGFRSITEPAHTLAALLGMQPDIFTISAAEEAPAVLEKLRQNGYHMAVCDMIVHTTARQLGLDAFLITSGVESLHSAIDQALSLSSWFVRLRRENTLLKSVTEGQEAIVVVLSADGSLYYHNSDLPDSLLDKLRVHRTEIPRNGTLRFYHSDAGTFFHVTAKAILLDRAERTLFYCVPSRIPLHRRNAGIRALSKGECEFLFSTSFYSLSGAMGSLGNEIKSLARLRQPILILGESGTGKEQIARYLYLHSALSNHPLVVVDCAEASEKSWSFLLEHYNSPLSDSGNTVYFQNLEQIAEDKSKALLSAITDTGLARRVRLLFSATVADEAPVSDIVRRFSERLGCMTLRLPSLRQRSDEIPSLASLYLNNLNLELGKQISAFEPRALELLRSYSWPNNYTQFKNLLCSLAALSDSAYIRNSSVLDLLARERLLRASEPSPTRTMTPEPPKTLDTRIREMIRQTVKANGGNRAAAARELGISRTTLWRYLSQSTFDTL
ncbi:sigma-54-dependent transcriptional regulator [Stomatobaculum longum]|uniref:sigma-54-dependent transcriptional regulator n=1 Tax=Stomatobaculum longum TaxID=796942 RepID=UPI0028E62265|nr:PrpR N-terminal domain-containing protein [Stomatobaculum longum]